MFAGEAALSWPNRISRGLGMKTIAKTIFVFIISTGNEIENCNSTNGNKIIILQMWEMKVRYGNTPLTVGI
jgi:hypothetical protein